METTAHSVRARVAKTYTRVLEAAERNGRGCCGPTSHGPAAGTLEADIDVPSFGCGDPLLFANVEKGATVLDLGSGPGYDLIAAAERVGPEGHVIGIDMNDDMLNAARRNAEAAGLGNIEVRKGIIEDLPVESSSVDWVISNCVVNLSPEKDRVFAEIARVLKPGGKFSISDICVEDLPAWVLADEAAYDGCIAGAVSEIAYVRGLRKAGLTDLLIDSKFAYTTSQLNVLAEEATDRSCCGSDLDLSEIEGKVWSIRFTGMKR